MKEEDSNPLEPVGDEPLEARIVAWVLGDASAFEAAELERLCEERPELLVFRRRMQDLHGLLSEADAAKPDEAWKLPADKRAKIEALFGAMHGPSHATVMTPKPPRQPWLRQALMATAACLVLAVGFSAVFGTAGVNKEKAKAAHERVAVQLGKDAAFDGLASRRSLPVAEGYASRSPVLPEIADLEADSAGPRSELAPARPMAGGIDITGGSHFRLETDRVTASNGRAETESRARTKSGSDVPLSPHAKEIPSLAASKNFAGRTTFGAVASPPPASAPDRDQAQTKRESRFALGVDREDVHTAQRQEVAPPAIPGEPGQFPVTPATPSTLAFDGPSGGASAAPGTGAGNIVTGGLRSGDGAITRNNIDSVLNNPNRTSRSFIPAPADGKPAESLDRVAELGDRVEIIRESQPRLNEPSGAIATKSQGGTGGAPAKPIAGEKDKLAVSGKLSVPGQATTQNEAGNQQGANFFEEAPKDGFATAYTAKPALGANQSDSELTKDLAAPADPFAAGQVDSAHAGKSKIDGSLADRKTARGGETVADSDKLLMEGRDAYAKGDYQHAVDKYKKALDDLPQGSPAFDERKDAYAKHLADGSVALAQQYRKQGKYDEAKQLLNDVLKDNADPENLDAKRELAFLEDPIRTSQALSPEHTQDVEKVRKGLYLGEGNFNLGKYDEAKKEFENVLRTDPYNTAARRFMERIASAKSDYYRAGYDYAKAELLMQVDRSGELPAPVNPSDKSNLAEKTASVESLKAMIAEREAGVQKYKEALTFYDNSEKAEKLIGENASPEAIAELKEKMSGLGDLVGKDRLQDALNSANGEVLQLKRQLAAAEATVPALAAPKPAPVVLDETVAAAEPFSTFSLHVSDASFKLAKAALDRGERLSADQIRPEEFYNAFDYGDPAPAPGEAVACTIEQSGHPVLPQRNIVRVAMRVGSTGRSQGQPLNLTVLLDNSGSMEREDRHAGLKAAVAQLASLLQPCDTVTLAGFSRTPHLLADRLSGADAAKLVDLVEKLPSEGGTNLEEALKLAGELAVQRKNPAAQNRIVLLTDGAANLGNAQPDDLAEKVSALRQQGIAFDAAGIGAGGLNDRMLEALTRHGNGRYYIVNDPADADANFARQLAGAFRPAAENVKVQVHFNPDRVSHYKLIGFEKHRLNTEDFHNDAVDAAELAADEAGVALYQVETIPGGSGEIGEVSVRFRDTAAGQMVERTWTIPHDEKTPAFDQARPSIQLATLAMLAAEKLRGGPLADATDFTTLAPQIARVRSYYGNSSRVGELVGMTGKLK